MNHFSHQHPLELSTCQQTHMASFCSGCNLSLSGSIYTCILCNYSLHDSCSQAHQRLHHPADPNHYLTLLPCPAYPQGYFYCNACGHQGTGFSYHCSTCRLDIHILCAYMPLSLLHHAHHHQLHLAFFPPYQNNIFCCNICLKMGSNHWLYRCGMCNFDVHLGCVTQPLVQASPPPPPPPQMQAPTTGYASGIQHNYAQSTPSNGQLYTAAAIQGVVGGTAQALCSIM